MVRYRNVLSDSQLLERFAREGDSTAFESLMWRYGPLVLGSCQRRLGYRQDAEEAFQAVFLVFVRKAQTISRG